MGEPHLCPKCKQRTIYFDGICYWCRQKEKLEFYEGLSEDEIKKRQKDILARIDELYKYDEIYSDLTYIFYLHGICDEQIIEEVTKNSGYYPPEIYKKASIKIRDELIKRLSSEENIVKLNHILSALAWQGDEVVRELFFKLYNAPKPWKAKLHVDMDGYAQVAGWSFDESGKRRSLVFDKCFTCEPSKNEDASVKFKAANDEKCKFCSGEMLELTIKKESLKRLGLELKNDAVLKFCPTCIGLVQYFCQNDGKNMQTEVVGEGESEDYVREAVAVLDGQNFELASEVCAHYSYMIDSEILLGGYPQWQQHSEYLACPKCGKTMKYLAQIPFGALIDGEGTIYMQICDECEVVGANFQCT